MEALQTLGTALGLTMLAGINLYLTVFVTGLAIHLGWLTNYPPGLDVLADPIVLVVAGVFLVVETIADKCPYVDNVWDAVHTVVRPIGGMLIALQAVGDLNPVAEVVAVLLGGSIAFTAHSAKAGTRLVVNTSPEPVSNIILSTAEDVFVVAGAWFVFRHPILSLVFVTLFMVVFWYFAPKFFRATRAHIVGIIHRFASRRTRAGTAAPGLPRQPPGFAHECWLTVQRGREELAWAVPCFSGRMNEIGRHVRGCLLATTEGRLFFVGRKNYRTRIQELRMGDAQILDDPGALFHRVTLKCANGETVGFRFTRKYSAHVPAILQWVNEQSRRLTALATEPAGKLTGSAA
jgi:hypothetical protein